MTSRAMTGESLALAALVMFSISTILTKVASGRLSLNAVGNVLRGAELRSWDEAILGALLGSLAAIVLF